MRAKFSATPIAPEILIGSAIVDGDPPVWPGSIVIHNAKDARRVVGEIKESGADFVKSYNGIRRDAYFALADETRKQGIPFVGHLPFEVRAAKASDAGQRSIEHLTGIAIACSRREQDLIKQLRPLHNIENTNLTAEAIRSFDSAECEALFARFHSNKTWQVPTLTVLRALGYMNERQFTSEARVAYMSAELRRSWNPANDFRFRRWRPGRI